MIYKYCHLNWEFHLKKIIIFKLELISIFYPVYLKALMTFFCILDVSGPSLLRIEINPLFLQIPTLIKFTNLPSVSKMYIPTKSAISTESNDPIVTSKLSVVAFSQLVLL